METIEHNQIKQQKMLIVRGGKNLQKVCVEIDNNLIMYEYIIAKWR